MNARQDKRERKLKRNALIKKVAVNILAVILLGVIGTFMFCLIFGVFREGEILL